MTQTHEGPPADDSVSQMLVHLRAAHLLRAAVVLDLADTLEDEALSVADLAARTSTDPGVLGRLLAALASFGVFTLTDDGRYAHTALSRTMCSTHPVGRILAQDLKSDATWQAWSSLAAAAKEGRSPFAVVHGTDFYSYISEHDPEQAANFHQAMNNATEEDNGDVVAALGLPATGLVVDVGGGRGGLLRDVLRAAPDLRGVLFDVEGVIADALPELVSDPLASRCETVAGDALVAVPEGADLYLLRFILHNWGDEDCVRILESCARAARPGSRIVVVEVLLEKSGTPDAYTAMADMGMFVLFGSQERTEAEYAGLFERAGLEYRGSTATESLHLFEAVAR
ncbi:methyltransferase [Lentzea sp. BCCO 10_0798]|uniref:Methyltransferase n=1 Tax=Lentzea kristufekii TaxID=3095430 RepID=A0ABU4U1I3_9PSEU|nr:methyltransferase [Lentzea sp. BCCO 10_0798]MDX8054395.1 methyltransferase [Lentzea sp. BCCO 10_0798]